IISNHNASSVSAESSRDSFLDPANWSDPEHPQLGHCPTCGQSLKSITRSQNGSSAPAAGSGKPDELPWAERRLSERRPARNGARAEIRRWGISAGPDVAEELIDVSDVGLRVRLHITVRRGEQLDVTLWVPG